MSVVQMVQSCDDGASSAYCVLDCNYQNALRQEVEVRTKMLHCLASDG